MTGYRTQSRDHITLDIKEGAASGIDALKLLNVKGLDRVAAIKVDNNIQDLSAPVGPSSRVEPVFINSEEGLDILRHSASHVMAMAVKELFPGVKGTIGPAIENGFYYDFDYQRAFKDDDLPIIEEKMGEIAKTDYPFRREEMESRKAAEFFRSQGEA